GERNTVRHFTETFAGTAGNHHARGREPSRLDVLVGGGHAQTVQTIGRHVHEAADPVGRGAVGFIHGGRDPGPAECDGVDRAPDTRADHNSCALHSTYHPALALVAASVRTPASSSP